jgi:hypothetical protein
MNYHEKLKEITSNVLKELKQMNDAEMSIKPSPEKWSKKEILGHLIDSAYNNHLRFMRATEKPDLIFPGYDQPKWVRRNNYQNRPTSEIISTWEIVNNHIYELMKGIPEEVMNRKTTRHNFDLICMHFLEREKPTSLSYLVWDYLDHMEHHIAQILPNYQKRNLAFQA